MNKLFSLAFFAMATSSDATTKHSTVFIECQGGTSGAYLGRAKGTADTRGQDRADSISVYYIRTYNYAGVNSVWGSPGVTGLINVGGDYRFEETCVLLGGFIGGGISKMSVSVPFPGRIHSALANVTQKTLQPLSFSTSARLQAGLRVGCRHFTTISPVLMLGWSTFKSTVRLSANMTGGSQSAGRNFYDYAANVLSHKWLQCLMVGVGLEMPLSENVTLTMSSNAHISGKKTYNLTQTDAFLRADGQSDHSITYSFAPVLTEVLFSVRYVLPAHFMK